MISLEELFKNNEFQDYLQRGDVFLNAIGYNEHGVRHTTIVSANAQKILKELGFPEERCHLAGIAGALHDIGYIISKEHHQQYGALLAKDLLKSMGVNYKAIGTIMSAIANSGNRNIPVFSDIHAALVIADLADVHRERLRELTDLKGQLNDKVHFGVTGSALAIDGKAKIIAINIKVDTAVISMMEYFNTYLERGQISKMAAKFLNCSFRVLINDVVLD